jgi:succinate dehydrogenase/fumarate reductase cytochrome b subunit
VTYFQDNSSVITNSALVDAAQVINARKQLTNSIFSVVQVVVGVALLALSTHLAVESEIYLNALDQSGLNQYHVFALLVCTSFFAGILLIAQQVLHHDVNGLDEISSY